MKKVILWPFLILIFGIFIFFVKTRKEESTTPINFSGVSFNFVPGEENFFDLSQNTTISFKNQGKDESTTNLDLKGTLIQRVYQKGDDFIILGFKILDPILNLETSNTLEDLKKELSREIFLKISPKGKILNFSMHKNHNAQASNILRSIIAATQVILPEVIETSDDLNYQLTELNMNGPVQIEYKISFQKNSKLRKPF